MVADARRKAKSIKHSPARHAGVRILALAPVAALLIALALLAGTAAASGPSNTWYFGTNAGLDFSSGSPVALTDGAMSTSEGCAVVSDSSGNLPFYTDGRTVYNRTHAPMPSGTGLLGSSSSTQSAIAAPVLGSATEYYIFTKDTGAKLNYSIVDMTLDGGNGDVTTKNVPISTLAGSEKIAIAEHSNGTDLWLLSANSSEYLAFPITASGVSTTPVLSPVTNYNRGIGYLRVSPDGLKVASASDAIFEFLDFDPSTGQLTVVESGDLGTPYGVEFSPDGQLLYVSHFGGWVYQYDLSASPILSSATLLYAGGPLHWSRAFGALQLGPDDKIYMAQSGKGALSVIDQPNVVGIGATFKFEEVDLGGQTTVLGLPNFPAFVFAPEAPDADEDGVQDGDDLCPGTAAGAEVDANVCSDSQVDGDGDGSCAPGAPSGGPSGCTGSDCDDADSDNYPGNTEVCDGQDNDCDSEIDEGFDNDGDGTADCFDVDDDNDGVADGADADAFDPDVCEDLDADTCDDCAVGSDDFGPLADNDPADDGPDADGDGLCDAGDPTFNCPDPASIDYGGYTAASCASSVVKAKNQAALDAYRPTSGSAPAPSPSTSRCCSIRPATSPSPRRAD